MTHSRIFSIFSALIFCAMFIAAGCSSSSSPSTNNTNSQSTSVKPKMGSTFTDSVSVKDTSLVNQPGSSVTYTLIDTNAAIAGKSGVYVFVSSSPNPASTAFDTLYQYYETNGDLSVYVDCSAGGFDVGQEWVTFPFASQTSSNITTFNAVLIDTITISGIVQGSGTGTQTVDGNSIFVEKSTLKSQAKSAIAGTIPATVTITYAPSIGLVIYQDISESGSVFGENISGGSTSFLTNYTLK
jgi:hypothetical protein